MCKKSDACSVTPTRTMDTREQFFFSPHERAVAEMEARERRCYCYAVVDSRSAVPRPLMLIVVNRDMWSDNTVGVVRTLRRAGLWKRMWSLVLVDHVSPESWAKVFAKN